MQFRHWVKRATLSRSMQYCQPASLPEPVELNVRGITGEISFARHVYRIFRTGGFQPKNCALPKDGLKASTTLLSRCNKLLVGIALINPNVVDDEIGW